MNIEKLYHIFMNKCDGNICTDTRDIISDSLFFSLSGETHNGNKYAKEALEKGVHYVVVDDEYYFSKEDDRYILVENSQDVLVQLAKYHRKQFNIPVLAITGSNGKTTTKELISSVLKTEKNIIVTEGNLNNHIGVPKTLLNINIDTEIAIIEMGANHVGEIAKLCEIAKPTHGIITNVGRAHLGLFGGYDGVIRAKTELYRYLEKKNGISFVNGDDELLLQHSNTLEKITYFSENSDYPVYSKNTLPYVSLKWREYGMKSKLTGEYNLMNIAAAIAVGHYFDILDTDIKKGIENYEPTNSRSEIVETKNGNLIIKDFYNANRSSMLPSLKNLALMKINKDKIVILGDMFELGEFEEEEHRAVLEEALRLKFDRIILVGKAFADISFPDELSEVEQYPTTEGAIFALQKSPIQNATILLKASNGMNFEKIFNVLD